jgi:hypothetical protein
MRQEDTRCQSLTAVIAACPLISEPSRIAISILVALYAPPGLPDRCREGLGSRNELLGGRRWACPAGGRDVGRRNPE